ncbi:MAG: hypothetical protein LUE89_04095 [Clostridiales bacterium]|nr:hypothetical protein [Clostridiales bacterium]
MSNLFRHLPGPVAEIHKPIPVILPEFYKFQPDILYALFWVSSMANNKVIKRKSRTTDIKGIVKRAFKVHFVFCLRTTENSRREGIFLSVEKGEVLSESLYCAKPAPQAHVLRRSLPVFGFVVSLLAPRGSQKPLRHRQRRRPSSAVKRHFRCAPCLHLR